MFFVLLWWKWLIGLAFQFLLNMLVLCFQNKAMQFITNVSPTPWSIFCKLNLEKSRFIILLFHSHVKCKIITRPDHAILEWKLHLNVHYSPPLPFWSTIRPTVIEKFGLPLLLLWSSLGNCFWKTASGVKYKKNQILSPLRPSLVITLTHNSAGLVPTKKVGASNN